MYKDQMLTLCHHFPDCLRISVLKDAKKQHVCNKLRETIRRRVCSRLDRFCRDDLSRLEPLVLAHSSQVVADEFGLSLLGVANPPANAGHNSGGAKGPSVDACQRLVFGNFFERG